MRQMFIDSGARAIRVGLILATLSHRGSAVWTTEQTAAPQCQSSGPLERITECRKQAASPSAAALQGGFGRTTIPVRRCSLRLTLSRVRDGARPAIRREN
jgi:hypothetical protein